MFWMDGESVPDAADAALDGAWALLVELRTGFPEIRSAHARSDLVFAARCLDHLVAKTGKVAPALSGWPNLAREVAAAAATLKVHANDTDAWLKLENLADDLKEGIAHATMQHNASENEEP